MPADTVDTAALRDLCVELATAGGSAALAGRRAAGDALGRDTKSSPTDLVTEFDCAAEDLIVTKLRAARPDDAIVGEEGADHPGTTGFAWHIDPIDGTTNYVYDLPTWSCSVGVTHHGVGVAGAVYAPALGEMYAAAAGHGATLDGRPIHASGIADAALALVATGFSYQAETRIAQARRLVGLVGRVRDVRRYGSAALDLCLVASGRVDVYYETGLNSWDITAGEVICREAGAITSDWSGGRATPAQLLACAPGIHPEFVALLADGVGV